MHGPCPAVRSPGLSLAAAAVSPRFRDAADSSRPTGGAGPASVVPARGRATVAVRLGLRAWGTGPLTSPPPFSRLPVGWVTPWLLVGAGHALSPVWGPS